MLIPRETVFARGLRGVWPHARLFMAWSVP